MRNEIAENLDAPARATTPLRFVFIGLTITSSWGNGHATTYRGLVRELVQGGYLQPYRWSVSRQ